MTTRVRRRAEREPVVVVVADWAAYVEGADPDEVQLIALSAGLAHEWDQPASRWAFAASDALAVAAALRACGRRVRLASGGERP